MRTQPTPVFDKLNDTIVPNGNWNVLLENARKTIYTSCAPLGSYIANVTLEHVGFSGLDEVKEAFIAAAEPPMSEDELFHFNKAFDYIYVLEDAFAMTIDKNEQAVEGVTQ